MILLQCGIKDHNISLKGNIKARLSSLRRPLNWEMPMRITTWHFCIKKNMELKGMSGRCRTIEEAAIAGQPQARLALGNDEWDNNNDQRAVKHWIIAATQGDDRSILTLMALFKMGCLSKEDLAAALRAHHAAVDATKSPQRKAAEECFNVLHALHNLGYKL
jgi:hypothetical protein